MPPHLENTLVLLGATPGSAPDLLTVKLGTSYERYVIEIVEAFRFCPFSQGSRLRGEVGFLACATLGESFMATLLHPSCARLDVVLVAFPFAIDSQTFAAFVQTLRNAHQFASGGAMIFAMEPFFPTPIAETPPTQRGGQIRLARHTPFATIQLTRLRALDRVKATNAKTRFVDAAAIANAATLDATALDALLAQPVDLTESIHAQIEKSIVERYDDIKAALTDIDAEANDQN